MIRKSTFYLPAFDWGVAFAANNARKIFLLALLPWAAELTLSYWSYSSHQTQGEFFLLAVLGLAIKAWMLSVAVLWGMTHCRREEFTLVDLGFRAVRFLPKVLISYILLVLMGGVSAIVWPLFFLVVTMLWAPSFCVGETFFDENVKRDSPAEESSDDDLDGYFQKSRFDEEAEEATFFEKMSIFHLGFRRSAKLTFSNPLVTFLVVLLLWCSHVTPAAIMLHFTKDISAFWPIVLQVYVSLVAELFSALVLAGCFIWLLPQRGREELGIIEYVSPGGERAEKTLDARFQGSRLTAFLLFAVALASTWVVVLIAEEKRSFPDEASLSVVSSERSEEQLRLELTVVDSQWQFRWFHPGNMKVRLAPRAGDEKKSADAAVKEDLPRVIDPARIIVRNEDGETLLYSRIAPYEGELSLAVFYDVSRTVESKREFELIYVNLFGEPQVVYRGMVGELITETASVDGSSE